MFTRAVKLRRPTMAIAVATPNSQMNDRIHYHHLPLLSYNFPTLFANLNLKQNLSFVLEANNYSAIPTPKKEKIIIADLMKLPKQCSTQSTVDSINSYAMGRSNVLPRGSHNVWLLELQQLELHTSFYLAWRCYWPMGLTWPLLCGSFFGSPRVKGTWLFVEIETCVLKRATRPQGKWFTRAR